MLEYSFEKWLLLNILFYIPTERIHKVTIDILNYYIGGTCLFSPRTLAGIGSSRLIRTSEMLFRRGVTHRKNFLIYSSGRKFSQIRREDQLEHSLDSFDKKQKIFNEVFASLHWAYFLVFFFFILYNVDRFLFNFK